MLTMSGMLAIALLVITVQAVIIKIMREKIAGLKNELWQAQAWIDPIKVRKTSVRYRKAPAIVAEQAFVGEGD